MVWLYMLIGLSSKSSDDFSSNSAYQCMYYLLDLVHEEKWEFLSSNDFCGLPDEKN